MIKIILVHGFNKSGKDMKPLQQHLTSLGYDCFLPNFPITFKKFEVAASLLEEFLARIIQNQFAESASEKINFVGHSTGGLVIRKMLSETKFAEKIGRSVLIATPNKGSKLAGMAGNIPAFTKIYNTLESLSYEYIAQMGIKDKPRFEIGAIAGNSSNLFLGHFINKENDGRVEVNSVNIPNLNDFIVLPYGHKEIHHKKETALLVDTFLKKGKFK